MGIRDGMNVRVYGYGIDPLNLPTTDSLVLGHATRGKIGAVAANKVRNQEGTTGTHYRGMQPTDLSCYVASIAITRGRRGALQSFDGGRMTLELDASDRRFDPLYTSGAYAVASRQLFRRGTPIVCATGYATPAVTGDTALFSGFVDSIEYDYNPMGTMFRATVQCVDAFDLLARVDLNASDLTYGSGETMGARIDRWLEVGGWHLSSSGSTDSRVVLIPQCGPYASRRYGTYQRAAGTYTLQGTNLAENALTAIKAAAASGDGYVFVDAMGRVVWGTDKTDSAPALASFSDSGAAGAAPFSTCRPFLDTSDYANVFQWARSGGATQTGVASNIDNETRVQSNRTDLLNTSDTDVKTIVDAMASRHGTPPVNAYITIHPWENDASMDVGTVVDLTANVRWQWTAVGLDVTGFVSGIEHRIRPGVSWDATYLITQRL